MTRPEEQGRFATPYNEEGRLSAHVHSVRFGARCGDVERVERPHPPSNRPSASSSQFTTTTNRLLVTSSSAMSIRKRWSSTSTS